MSYFTFDCTSGAPCHTSPLIVLPVPRVILQVNHFPGSFQMGRKDRLWRNLSRLQLQFGRRDFGFFPQTFVLPADLKLLRRAWEDGGNRLKWIIKPVTLPAAHASQVTRATSHKSHASQVTSHTHHKSHASQVTSHTRHK